MKQDNVFFEENALPKLVEGARKVSRAVAGTLGAAGWNAAVEHQNFPYVLTTNDGITIAKSIVLADPVENMGANLLKEIATRSDKVSGDGTTTSIVLAQAILDEGLKVKDASPMEIKNSLDACLPIIEASIKKQTREITVDEVKAVATISAEDEKIGALIQEIYQKIGKDGILYTDISKTYNDFYTIGSGIQIEGAGLCSQYMADTQEQGGQISLKTVASLKNPKILITKQKITSAKIELNSFLESLFYKDIKELVIFCDDFEPLVLPELLSPRDKGFRIVLIKLPVLWKDWWFEDIAKMTGSTVVDGVGITLKTVKQEHLGTCGSVMADKNSTFLDGILDVTEYAKKIEEDNTDEAKIRAARLNTKTARLFIGAATETAFNYRRLKIEDARNASWQALHSGIVAGGGVALLNCRGELLPTTGGRILRMALQAPAMQIRLNAGRTVAPIIEYDPNTVIGFNAKTKTLVDMFEAGIVDPANVVLTAIRNAISVAGTILTAKVVVVLPPKEPEPKLPQ